MAEHLEIELKWALDAAAHTALGLALERQLGPPRRLEQDNRFFDTPDRRLRRGLLNLRLRRENDRLLMTCKGRGGLGPDGEHRHREWEEWLDPGLWPRVMDGTLAAVDLPLPTEVREVLDHGTLEALGGFANLRLEFHQRETPVALLCLDRTTFNDQRVDYELEIETAEPAASARLWRERLEEWGIPFTPQPLTKFARFCARASA
jgi:uncharacterized protein YjbK